MTFARTFRTLALATGLSLAASAAGAASLFNADGEEIVVMVTQDGNRTEVAVGPKSTVTVCEKGCFISFPTGDMLALTGSETVVVERGTARIDGQ